MRKLRNFVFAVLGVVLVIVLAGLGFYFGRGGHTQIAQGGAAQGLGSQGIDAQGAAAPGREQAQPTSSPQPAAGPVQASVFEQQVREAKIVSCARMFSALGNGMTRNFDYTAQSRWDGRSANDHAIASMVALKPHAQAPGLQPDGGVIFAAPVGGACEGQVVRVTPVARACPDVAAQLAKSNGQSSPLGEMALMTMPGGVQVMLVPFDRACVTVTVLKTAG